MEPTVVISGLAQVGKMLEAVRHKFKDHKLAEELNPIWQLLLESEKQAFERELLFRELQDKLQAFERWDETAEQYQLHELHPDRLVYKLRAPKTELDKKVFLCATCFGKRIKSILQVRGNYREVYECPECKYVLCPPSDPSKAETPRWRTNRRSGWMD